MSDSDFIRNVNSVQNGAFSTPEIAEITDLAAKLQTSEETGAEATRMMVAAIAEQERFKEALGMYGRHLANCASSFGFSKGYSRPCDCGFGDFFEDTDDD